jgi:predicted transcriptional regulator
MVQIRILNRNFLIQEKSGVFSLTSLGEYTVREMRNILDMFSVFDENPEYWGEAELTAFPAYLLSRIGELGAVKLHYPDKAHIFDRARQVEKSLRNVESIVEVSSIFRQEYVTDYLEIVERNKHVTFIFTPEVIDRLEREFSEIYFKYMKHENVRIFVCPEIKLASCMVTDKIISLSLFTKRGRFFNHDLISYDQSAIAWGADLFHHFRSLSMIHNLQE